MNPFFNPMFLSWVLKSYLSDIDRLRTLNEKELREYQDKCLKNIVKYAYSVPLYHDKYKKAGIQPTDINGIKDIEKLPIVTKYDIKSYYPDGIISTRTQKEQLLKISTSGTTGKSLTIYSDMYDVIRWFFGYIRIIREYGINWRKDRMTIIGDFAPHTIGTGYIKRGLFSNLNNRVFFSNMQWLNTNDEPREVVKEVNLFNPEFIGGYPGMLGHLALLKENGYGKDINPKYIATIGSVLDKNLKRLIEETFNAHVFEVYGATESGTIAFQCKHGNYHIMSDLVYLEFFRNGEPVNSREPGNMIVTRLFGRGTPIIRYNAINDIVSPLYEKCTCGMSGGLIDRIYGRDDLSLCFSGGRILLPSSISEIYSRILYELKTTKVKETQIIQHSTTKIEIQLEIDKQLKDKDPSVEKIFSIILKGFQEKVGPEVEIIIREVEKVDKTGPRIISKVDRTTLKLPQYI
jgi:phenylacetate-CoA ligase